MIDQRFDGERLVRTAAGTELCPSAGPSVPPAVSTERGPVFVPHLEEQELSWTTLDQRAVDTVRVLAADAVEKVGNGHPGTAMSLAPAAYLLFQKLMRHDPKNPDWLGRDRFILSPGHTSLTLYIQLFLSGYGLELKDLEALRTWGSLTPGHPEYKHTAGVEITTGPLGQGLASAVGFAYSQRRMRGLFDADAPAGTSPFDHTVWVIASDGDLQEGVTSEASSLAGHQELGNLVVIYDENHISHRGRHRRRLHRRRPGPLRGLRLAHPARRLDPHRRVQGRRAGTARRPARREGRDVQAVHHLAADHHRLPGTEEAEHRQDPRLGPGRRGSRGPEEGPRLRPGTRVPGRRGRPGPHPRRAGPRRRGPHRLAGSVRGLAVRQPRGRRPARARRGQEAPGRARRRPAGLRSRQGRLHPRRVRQGPERDRPGHARTLGRLRRPRRVQQHHDRGLALVHPGLPLHRGLEGQPLRPGPALRHPRTRRGVDRERHRACTGRPGRSPARS